MTFTMEWKENSVEFVYQGDLGAVSLFAIKTDQHWHPNSAVAHRPQRGSHRFAGVCPYVDGPCELVEIDKRRAVIPIARWERHHSDPAVVEKIMLAWYQEFVE
jgi:hypothetical protein